MTNLKIIFMGTADFSAIVLDKLNSVYPISAIVTGVDKASGRGNIIKYSEVKEYGLSHNIPVLQYNKVSKEGIDDIKKINPDLVITAAFGQILSEEFLSIPKHGVLNVHASLLPKYRGSSPIQWSIINGDKVTGVTIMKTVKEIDAGDILLQEQIDINENDTADILFDKLAILGGELIIKAVELVDHGKDTYIKQDHSKATHCKMIAKEDGLIDFNKSFKDIINFINGMTPWPSAYTKYNNKILKIFKISKYSDKIHEKNGEVISSDAKNGLIISCNDGELKVETLQLEGTKKMQAEEFLRGRCIDKGYIF